FALGGGCHHAAELLRHGLHAVADAEYRDPELEHRRRRAWRFLVGHRFRPAGEDHATRAEGPYLGIAHVPGTDLAVDAELAHAPRDQLRVLRSEVEDQDAVRMNIRMHGGSRGSGVGRSGNTCHVSAFRTPGSWVP